VDGKITAVNLTERIADRMEAFLCHRNENWNIY